MVTAPSVAREQIGVIVGVVAEQARRTATRGQPDRPVVRGCRTLYRGTAAPISYAIGAFVAMGVAYWIALFLATAFLASVAAFLIAAAIAIYAFIACFRLLGRAIRERDAAWVCDLIFSTLAAILGVYVAIRNWPSIDRWSSTVFDRLSENPQTVDMVALFGVGVAFFVGLFDTGIALATEDRLFCLLAYPGFAFYGWYAARAIQSMEGQSVSLV